MVAMRIWRRSVASYFRGGALGVRVPARAATPVSGAGQVASDAPEVRQRSALDCGPAALQAVLQGFGVQVEYEKLRAFSSRPS